MPTIVSAITVELKAEHRDEYVAAARELIDWSRIHSRALSHDMHFDPNAPCRCLITLEWPDEETARAHFVAEPVTAFLARTTSWLAQPALCRTYAVVARQALL